MRVITEDKVMKLIKQGKTVLNVPRDTIITPSAMERLTSKKIRIIREDDNFSAMPEKPVLSTVEQKKQNDSHNIDEEQIDRLKKETPKYISEETGAFYLEKPEYMTSLRKNFLVLKNNKRIILRGKIDSFIAQLMMVMSELSNSGFEMFISDLESILECMRNIQYAEVTDSILKEPRLLGLTYDELRDHSQHPHKYYGEKHLFNLNYDASPLAIKANLLRAIVRELEITAFDAYYVEHKMQREDIITALNRLSSAFYIIEIKAVGGMYSGKKGGGAL